MGLSNLRAVQLPQLFLFLLVFVSPPMMKAQAQAQGGSASPGLLSRPTAPIQTTLPPIIVDFRDIAEQAGLTAVNVSGGVEKKDYILETTGGGVAIFDYDNDGLMDIFLVNGTTMDGKELVHRPPVICTTTLAIYALRMSRRKPDSEKSGGARAYAPPTTITMATLTCSLPTTATAFSTTMKGTGPLKMSRKLRA